MKVLPRLLAAVATSAVLLLPLTACSGGDEKPAPSTSSPTTTTLEPSDGGGQTSASPTGVAAETPQQRVVAYAAASDQAAADGWKDLSYLDDYLTPELAAEVRKSEEQNASSGAVITGHTVLSDFRLTDQTETEATIEFCEDARGLTATKGGEPTPIANATDTRSVAQYTLVRDSAVEPWMISVIGYYDKETTCEAHFGA